MADHRAEQIMAAVLTKLTGLTTTGDNIERGRAYNLQASGLPALSVYMGSDTPIAAQSVTNVAFMDSALSVYVDAFVRSATVQTETTLNLIKKEVQIALMADYTQGLSWVLDTQYLGSEEPAILGEGDQIISNIRINWRIEYRASIADPSA